MGNTEREAQVTQEIATLNTYVEDAFAILRTLHNRLDGVLTTVPPSLKDGDKVATEIPLVPVATEVRDIRYKVGEMIGLTQSILSRLEL